MAGADELLEGAARIPSGPFGGPEDFGEDFCSCLVSLDVSVRNTEREYVVCDQHIVLIKAKKGLDFDAN